MLFQNPCRIPETFNIEMLITSTDIKAFIYKHAYSMIRSMFHACNNLGKGKILTCISVDICRCISNNITQYYILIRVAGSFTDLPWFIPLF